MSDSKFIARKAKAILVVIFSLVCSLLILEFLLRLMPVRDPTYPIIDNTNKIYRFLPNQSVIFSKGPSFDIVTRKRINNAGFFNRSNYMKQKKRTRVAFIGDSYVEAKHVNDGHSFFDLISSDLEIDSYSFGVSGASLIDYINYLSYAKKYNPDLYVILIINNDFDESYCSVKSVRGFSCIDNKGEIFFNGGEIKKTFLKDIAYRSSLLRYLYLTSGINPKAIKNNLLYLVNGGKASEKKEVDARLAINVHLENILRLVQDKSKILYLFDADRPGIYGENPNDFFLKSKVEFKKRLSDAGVKFLDLDEVMREDYQRNGERFEFKNDMHWTNYGHLIASEAVKGYLVGEAAE